MCGMPATQHPRKIVEALTHDGMTGRKFNPEDSEREARASMRLVICFGFSLTGERKLYGVHTSSQLQQLLCNPSPGRASRSGLFHNRKIVLRTH